MKIDRINRIHELLKSVHNISINDLCDTFQVSKNTIRRDIAELEQQGLIKKVYGGIVLAEPSGRGIDRFRCADKRCTVTLFADCFADARLAGQYV